MLTTEIANDIVKETSLRIDRNVNIMNNKGEIIASRDKSRVGKIHEGALEVLKKGETLIIPSDQNENWKGAQSGINLPIVFQERVLGVIGITGAPEEMGELAGLVKMTTELMIRQEFIASQMEWKQRTKEMIIEELLKTAPSYDQISRGLNILHLKLQPPFIILIVQIKERSIPNQTLINKLEDIVGQGNGIIGFININRLFIGITGLNEEKAHQQIDKVYHFLKELHIKFRISYSLPFNQMEGFNQSYLDCDLSLNISGETNDLVSFGNLEAKAFIYQINRSKAERFFHRIKENLSESEMETLEVFFSTNLNIQKASEELFIHRNTLIYRLQRIVEKTGYDPKKFHDALTLQIALWLFEKLKHNP
ncbi:transcriptional regulator [Thalassobacillus devorans]|uniref:Transcriptional regulator n=1 Tax=Thalassobacillus devorans TaxID=279813 RepID=A0ABQ1NUI8_9BACI|nr:sugar diacid recognition domain-containing protein [Thalassobacillus devorans]NIK28566.1 carbohydrate diacid regulator [Thalassobacillus devorans]GGC85222.1 transcriptional regulator [Thalassobacillus devorans]